MPEVIGLGMGTWPDLEFSASKGLPGSLLYRVHYTTLKDLLSNLPEVQVRNLGLVVGIARIIGVGA